MTHAVDRILLRHGSPLQSLKELLMKAARDEIRTPEELIAVRANAATPATEDTGEERQHKDVCPSCNGKGFVNMDGSSSNAFEGSDYAPKRGCDTCNGTGQV